MHVLKSSILSQDSFSFMFTNYSLQLGFFVGDHAKGLHWWLWNY